MASVRITKDMALGAARKIAAKLCDEKIEECKGRLRGYCDKLALIHVPSPVIQVCKEYGSVFYTVSRLMIRCNGYTRHIDISYRLPDNTRIEVSKKEFDAVGRHYQAYRDAQAFKTKEIVKWQNVILSLGTLKKLQDEMPDAVEYVEWPVVRDLPAVNYDVYRVALSSIKKMEGKK